MCSWQKPNNQPPIWRPFGDERVGVEHVRGSKYRLHRNEVDPVKEAATSGRILVCVERALRGSIAWILQDTHTPINHIFAHELVSGLQKLIAHDLFSFLEHNGYPRKIGDNWLAKHYETYNKDLSNGSFMRLRQYTEVPIGKQSLTIRDFCQADLYRTIEEGGIIGLLSENLSTAWHNGWSSMADKLGGQFTGYRNYLKDPDENGKRDNVQVYITCPGALLAMSAVYAIGMNRALIDTGVYSRESHISIYKRADCSELVLKSVAELVAEFHTKLPST